MRWCVVLVWVRESDRREGESGFFGRQTRERGMWVCGRKSGWCEGESDLIGRQSKSVWVCVWRERERGRKY